MVKNPTTLSSDFTCWLSGERSLPLGYLFFMCPSQHFVIFIDLTESGLAVKPTGSGADWRRGRVVDFGPRGPGKSHFHILR